MLLAMTLAPEAPGYPEMIRHGYASCTACHLSPNGGGVLTPYGRSLSREVLSTWGTESETGPFYGLATVPEPLLVGGDVRWMQTYINNSVTEAARTILMQADAELAANLEKWAATATVGRGANGGVTSRRHWVMYRPTEKISVRAGKFLMAYGIPDANHSLTTRKGIGFDQGSETYNVELAYQGETYEAFATFSVGRPDDDAQKRDTAGALRFARTFGETYKVGLSAYYGGTQGTTKALVGPYAMLGFTKHSFLLGEMDAIRSKTAAGVSSWGYAQSLRVDYEWVQGFHTYLLEEYLKRNFDDPKTEEIGLGGGLQWFPRPHLELMALYQKRKLAMMAPDFGDYAWLQLHFYL